MITSGIYLILNTTNNKYYIGSAINFRTRFENHTRSLNNNKHPNKHLQAAWNKYGKDSFKFSILELVEDTSKLIEREQYWFDNSNCLNGYNLAPKAGNNSGFKFSKESKDRLSKAMTGKKYAPHRKDRKRGGSRNSSTKPQLIMLNKSRIGIKLTDIHKANIANAMRKMGISPEKRAKMVEGLRRKSQKSDLTI